MDFIMNPEILSLIIKILSPILIALASWASTEIARYFRKKIKNKELENTSLILLDIGTKVVKEIYQTIGKSLKDKNSGKLTEDDIRSLKHTAMVKIKEELSEEVKEKMPEITNNIEIYLSSLIESIIYLEKLYLM